MNQIDQLAVNTIRVLAADSIQKANSGHPGLPLGAAPMAYALYGRIMKHNPSDPKWPDRDRFILSAGHGSMLLYTILHLFGYGLTMEDLKNFRQYDSKTPGHPEYGHTAGVETTTGPLGQGIANGVGMALAEAHLAARFNRPGCEIIDHYTYVLAGDGCMMEGISSEACSLAGTMGLGKLIVLYDDNGISIEGNTDIAFREDVGKRYESYGWQVLHVDDADDVDNIAAVVQAARSEKNKPTLIVVPSIIGRGCPAKEGSASAHGEPLGQDNIDVMKAQMGWKFPAFTVPDQVKALMEELNTKGAQAQADWEKRVESYRQEYPELASQWEAFHNNGVDQSIFEDPAYWSFPGKDASRNSSGVVLNRIADTLENLIGGSADLAPSTKTYMKGKGDFSDESPQGRNLHFGVREFAMAAISNGIALHGGLRCYCSTFFIFSDYMKHAMRLSALMALPVTYVLTHDSIGVGEDGPTHEPVEQLIGLRSIPGMTVFRPADSKEVAAGWQAALTSRGPVSLILSRQNLPLYEQSGEQALRGGYILADSKGTPDLLLMASGSEVELIFKARELLTEKGIDARVVSMPSWELFERQSESYKESVLPKTIRARVAVEAGVSHGWHRYVGLDGAVIAIDRFGASAPAEMLFKTYGFTVENVVETALRVLGK